MDTYEAFIEALDKQNPTWYIAYANEQELKDAMYNQTTLTYDYVCSRLKQQVADRLMMPVRACVHTGLVTPKEGF